MDIDMYMYMYMSMYIYICMYICICLCIYIHNDVYNIYICVYLILSDFPILKSLAIIILSPSLQALQALQAQPSTVLHTGNS